MHAFCRCTSIIKSVHFTLLHAVSIHLCVCVCVVGGGGGGGAQINEVHFEVDDYGCLCCWCLICVCFFIVFFLLYVST